MIGNQTHNQIFTVNEFSLPDNQTIQRVLSFIQYTLPEFESGFKQAHLMIHKEDDISKELSRYFNDKARTQNLLFQFNEKKGVDFTIYVTPYILGASSISMIECKRLSKKHYDYVSGDTGGIERFKREQDDFGKHLDRGAMIGYIQDMNHDYWHNKVNSWIEDLIIKDTDVVWEQKDKLLISDEISNFKSLHVRISEKPITLYHYWIALN